MCICLRSKRLVLRKTIVCPRSNESTLSDETVIEFDFCDIEIIKDSNKRFQARGVRLTLALIMVLMHPIALYYDIYYRGGGVILYMNWKLTCIYKLVLGLGLGRLELEVALGLWLGLG